MLSYIRANEAHRISVVNEIGPVARVEDIDVSRLMQSLPRAHDCRELDYAQPQVEDSIVPFQRGVNVRC